MGKNVGDNPFKSKVHAEGNLIFMCSQKKPKCHCLSVQRKSSLSVSLSQSKGRASEIFGCMLKAVYL